jgi:hypothetical protein
MDPAQQGRHYRFTRGKRVARPRIMSPNNSLLALLHFLELARLRSSGYIEFKNAVFLFCQHAEDSRLQVKITTT